MSLTTPKAEPEDDKLSLLSADDAELTNVASTPKLEGAGKPEYEGNGFLSAPLSGPIRPFSPDTLSVLSADEFEQIRPSRRSSQVPVPPQSLGQPQGWRGKLQASWIRNKGLAYMLVAQIFGTLMNVTTRLLEVEGNRGKGMHPFQILFARMGITFVLATGYMWYRKTAHFPLGMSEVRWLLVARGFGGFFGVFGMYYSLLYLPLADATVITFLAPGLTCWVCSILINEPFTRVDQIGTFVSFIGVMFIARPTTLFQAFGGTDAPPAGGTGDVVPGGNGTMVPPTESDAASYDHVTAAQRLGAVGIALLGVTGSVCAFTTIRWIGRRAHPLLSVNYFAAWCTIVSFVMQLTVVGFLLPATLKEWGYLVFLGVCGFVMQFLLAAALSYEKSSRATNMTYTQMLFALGFDKLIFNHTPGVFSIIGSSLILGSAIVVALQKNTGPAKDVVESSNAPADEESQRGLLSGTEAGEDRDRLPVQEVQLRTLR